MLRDRSADSLGSTGHDCDLADKFAHCFYPFSRRPIPLLPPVMTAIFSASFSITPRRTNTEGEHRDLALMSDCENGAKPRLAAHHVFVGFCGALQRKDFIHRA